MENKQQQLQAKLKNAPVDASQVHCSASSGLNKEETLSVQSKVRTCNNLDVNHSQHTGSSDLRVLDIVYVLNMRGEPLMPTTQQKSKKLLKQGKAKVVKRCPFTIQLKYATGEAKQPITLGIDSGYKFVGFSAVSDDKEVLSGELILRYNISKKIQDRALYRRTRRGKLWYRKRRFNNRTKPKGWLAPSIQHKVDTHLRLVQKIEGLLPIGNVIVEVASFDAQKMMNPEVSEIEYRQGELDGYEVREYLLEKWGHKCAYCNKKNIPLEIEHIVPKSKGGSNRVSNLTIACNKCNVKKGTMTAEEFGYPNIQKQTKIPLKEILFMNVVRTRIVEELICEYTYGYVTKHYRIKQKLIKSHINDAFIIAHGIAQQRVTSFICGQMRRNNRKLQINRKGFKPAIRRQHYKFQPNDLVTFNNKEYVVKGVQCSGKQIKVKDSVNKSRTVVFRKAVLKQYGKGLNFKYNKPVVHDAVTISKAAKRGEVDAL